MKKIIFIFAFVLLFVGVQNVSANCGDAIFDNSIPPVQTGTVLCGNGDPMNVYMSWGLMGYQTPQVKAGTEVIDEGGVKDTCPSWFLNGCFDLTKTD